MLGRLLFLKLVILLKSSNLIEIKNCNIQSMRVGLQRSFNGEHRLCLFLMKGLALFPVKKIAILTTNVSIQFSAVCIRDRRKRLICVNVHVVSLW